jgi:hypothetical protein
MITTKQLQKAADMRTGSKMSWVAIADVLGVETVELVQAVENNTGKVIPRETWAQPLGVVRQAAAQAPFAPAVPQVAEFIEGFPVVFDAGPPPPKLGDGRMAVLAQKLRPGAMVSPMKHAEFLSLRRCLTKMGMGSEFRWIDQKAGTVKAYVLAELSPRQKSMAVLMQAKAAAGKAMGRPKKRK